ncbi:hypothetical protein SAMN05880574_10479 [Chryseobacterium sp. RU37D]|uniref:hypothetical protein n=1 Tax=Chryseobacterium sp. RU37D TaxID=1907397 RepID=UPI000954A5DE|nr:hypothetical protein [Chryseobacterium sp. RU37D]SIQ03483.1 hypothetical protein SAMN05880574_10479 [Chryseobacterium sp. RU37D]
MSSTFNLNIKSFWISFLIFSTVCVGYYINALQKTDGHYIYLIDDAYIHLAMAKNFALYNVWGITKYKFSSTSSSPFFTYFLSVLIKIFGNNDQLPLYFNMISGLGLIYFLNKYFSKIFNSVKSIVYSVIFTLFFSILHLQLLSGMEHVLHVFLFVVNIFCFSNFKNKLSVFGFYFSLLLMGLVRFESMFYFVIMAFIFTIIKKWKEAVLVLLIGFLPIVVFCYFNYLHEGYFFPNSVVVKGTKFTLNSNFPQQLKLIFLDNFLLNISFYKIGLFPAIMGLVFIIRDFKRKNLNQIIKDNFLLIVISLLMICHSMFADLKGNFRYEAYILVGFSMVLIPRLKEVFENFKTNIKKEKLIFVLIGMNVFLLIYKLSFAHKMLDNGGKNVYEQQIQSAKFLHTYYNDARVVANDIGAITYFTDIHLLDIVGLGSKEMIPFNENKKPVDIHFENFLTQYAITNKYDVAVIYDEWFHGHVPKTWKKAAVLKINDVITVSKGEVSIYSIRLNGLESLKKNIKGFSWNKNVQVTIIN